MGMFDKVRNLFKGNDRTNSEEIWARKNTLSSQILDLIGSIKKIDSFNSSIWNISNITSFELSKKSVDELESLKESLTNTLNQLNRRNQSRSSAAIEKAKWTGERPSHLSEKDLNRLQRSDDR